MIKTEDNRGFHSLVFFWAPVTSERRDLKAARLSAENNL